MQENNAIGELNKTNSESNAEVQAVFDKAEYKLKSELVPENPELLRRHKRTRLAMRIQMLVVAVIMLGMSFLPFAYMDVQPENSRLITKIPINNVECIKITAFTAVNKSDYDIYDTEMYGNIENYYSIVEDELIGKVNFINVNRITKGIMYVNFMRASSRLEISSIICSLLCLVYFAFCVSFVVSSVKSLTQEVKACADGVEDDSCYNKTVLSLLRVFVTLIIVGLGFNKLCGVSFLPSHLLVLRGAGLDIGFHMSLALSGIVCAAILIHRLIPLRKNENGKLKPRTVSNLVATVLSFVAVLLIFLPSFLFDFGEYKNGTFQITTHYLSSADIFEVSSELESRYISVSSDASYKALAEVQKIILLGAQDIDIALNDFFNMLVIGYGRIDVRPTYIAIYLVSIALIALCGRLAIRSLGEILFGQPISLKKKWLKRIICVLSLVQFGLVVFLWYIANTYISGSLAKTSAISVSAFAFVYVFVALAMFINSLSRKKPKVLDRDFDNPDTAYAPYVVR